MLAIAFECTFPFSQFVGQDRLKRAMVLNAIDPTIGAVIVRGQRIRAKSSAVRSVARLLPAHEAVDGYVYRCDRGSDALVRGLSAPSCEDPLLLAQRPMRLARRPLLMLGEPPFMTFLPRARRPGRGSPLALFTLRLMADVYRARWLRVPLPCVASL